MLMIYVKRLRSTFSWNRQLYLIWGAFSCHGIALPHFYWVVRVTSYCSCLFVRIMPGNSDMDTQLTDGFETTKSKLSRHSIFLHDTTNCGIREHCTRPTHAQFKNTVNIWTRKWIVTSLGVIKEDSGNDDAEDQEIRQVAPPTNTLRHTRYGQHMPYKR